MRACAPAGQFAGQSFVEPPGHERLEVARCRRRVVAPLAYPGSRSVIPATAPAGKFTTAVVGRYYDDDLVDEAFPFDRGCLLPLDRPGLGIAVNPRKLERYREA